MKLIDSSLLQALSSQVRSITRCLLITRRDGEVFGFTEFDRDLTFASVTFKSFAGLSPTAASFDLSFAPNNLEFSSLLDSGGVTATDLRLGLFDYARVSFFIVNYLDLPTSLTATPPKHLVLPVRVLGKVSYSEGDFQAELMGLSRFLEGRIGDVTSRTCRYEFGDSRCGVTTNSFAATIPYTGPRDSLSFYTNPGGVANDRFTGSIATWSEGSVNEGLEFIVIRQLGNTFFLAAPLPLEPDPGDTFSVIPNCQKRFEDCQSFNNTLNFGGENKLPGLDAYISLEAQG